MNLTHITATACHECGCTEIKRMELSNKHSNGQWNERLTFACGLDLRYSPNHQKIVQEDDCEKSERSLTWNSQRKHIAQAMVEAAKLEAGKLDADLSLMLTNLRIDLRLYRDELETIESEVNP